ncbi:hypothetical protein RI129_002975 [Pyrocoelia pectoralis]|uniref:MADF domain-containing protein n=1 Tax=Pyrocoelia pectoralis TaxID=417401 RepID=A0AAN7ZUF1_9COLE
MSEKENFNTDMFIDEIEKRPAVWDMTCSEHGNKILKRRVWEELVIIFCEGDESDDKKKILGNTYYFNYHIIFIYSKWKSLRDNYIREFKKWKTVKSGSGASKKSSYIHFNRLQFLQPSVASKDTESSFDSINTDTSTVIANAEARSTFKSPDATPRTKKQKLNPADERCVNILEKSLTQGSDSKPKEDDDEDKLFCLSLYKEIKKIPESKRLKTKIDIYNLILQGSSTTSSIRGTKL